MALTEDVKALRGDVQGLRSDVDRLTHLDRDLRELQDDVKTLQKDVQKLRRRLDRYPYLGTAAVLLTASILAWLGLETRIQVRNTVTKKVEEYFSAEGIQTMIDRIQHDPKESALYISQILTLADIYDIKVDVRPLKIAFGKGLPNDNSVFRLSKVGDPILEPQTVKDGGKPATFGDEALAAWIVPSGNSNEEDTFPPHKTLTATVEGRNHVAIYGFGFKNAWYEYKLYVISRTKKGVSRSSPPR